MNTACPDLRGKQWTKAVPPIPHGLIADLDAALEQAFFDLSQRQRVSDMQHHREANDLGRTVEISAGISHRLRLRNSPSPLKPIYSDNALLSCKLTPLSQGSGSGLFENSAAVEVALVVEMVIDRGMDGGEFL